MRSGELVDLLVVPGDSHQNLLKQARPCHDCRARRCDHRSIRGRRNRLSNLLQPLLDTLGIAAVVIDEEPLDRRRSGTLELVEAWPSLQKLYRDVGPDLVEPVKDLGKVHLPM